MKPNLCFPAIFFPVLWILPTLKGEPFDGRLSPDGRFRFEVFSVEDNDAGRKPAFGIVETSSGHLVSDPDEDLGDAFRPSETIHWAPDSLSYALTSRVGTRHLDTFFFRWNGTAFERAAWAGSSELEEWADHAMREEIAALGLPANSATGQCLRGDDLVERWLDSSRVILRTELEHILGGEDRETSVAGSSRAIARWNPGTRSYEIERELHVPTPWPTRIEPDDFEVSQSEPAPDGTICRITVTRAKTGETRSFEAENWLTEPLILHSEEDWPALELVNQGPEGFEWRRIYRLVGGSYRCTRIAELTRFPRQAPEDAPLLELDPGSFAVVLRDRNPGPQDPETYESFQTESHSPGGKWKAVFTYHPQYLQRIEISASNGSGEPSVIYDFDEGLYGPEVFAEPLWSPGGEAVALYFQEGPRVGATLLYRQVNGVWSEAEMPEIDYGFLERANEGKNAHWGQQLESPLFWKNPRELVLSLEGHFRGDEGFDYRGVATLNWDKTGQPAGCLTVSTSPE